MAVYLTVGAMLSLIGLIAIYQKSGVESFDLINLPHGAGRVTDAGDGAEEHFWPADVRVRRIVSLWPFHTWAPLAYGAAPSSAAMLLPACSRNSACTASSRLLCPAAGRGNNGRHHSVAMAAGHSHDLDRAAGLAGPRQCARDRSGHDGPTRPQADDRLQLVMHMGYAFLGIASLSVLGAGGVVMLMFGHGLSVALLFLLATSIHHRTQTFDLTEMGGLAQKTPVLAALFTAATLASIGLPGFANFWGELSIFVALWSFSPWITAAAVAGIVISAIYGLRAVARVFFGPATPAFENVAVSHPPSDLRWSEGCRPSSCSRRCCWSASGPACSRTPSTRRFKPPFPAANLRPPR